MFKSILAACLAADEIKYSVDVIFNLEFGRPKFPSFRRHQTVITAQPELIAVNSGLADIPQSVSKLQRADMMDTNRN